MKPNPTRFLFCTLCLLLVALLSVPQTVRAGTPASTQPSAPIPVDQIGAVAGKQYSGDGLAVLATPEGAQLRCLFQKLDGEVTREGLWLASTVAEAPPGKFRVVATAVKREGGGGVLAATGRVEVADQLARFIRPGLTEEYRVSVDGVRQDFLVEQRPGGAGPLRVELAVAGAKLEPLNNGVRLVLDGSGRTLNYNRLRVVDAKDKELSARLEVVENSAGAASRPHGNN